MTSAGYWFRVENVLAYLSFLQVVDPMRAVHLYEICSCDIGYEIVLVIDWVKSTKLRGIIKICTRLFFGHLSYNRFISRQGKKKRKKKNARKIQTGYSKLRSILSNKNTRNIQTDRQTIVNYGASCLIKTLGRLKA